MAPHAVVEASVASDSTCFKWIVYSALQALDVTGFKAVFSLSQCLHDRIALHELARLHDEFGHALRRSETPVARVLIHAYVGAQTDADDQRTEYHFAIITDQERLFDQRELRPLRKHLRSIELLDTFASVPTRNANE
jgi:hypothetical protein